MAYIVKSLQSKKGFEKIYQKLQITEDKMVKKQMGYQKLMIYLLGCIVMCSSMQVVVKGELTCLQFEVDQTDYPMLFSYHMNPHMDEVNMVIYDRNTNKLVESGGDMNYKSFIQIKFNQTGLYPVCFEKRSAKDATVQFDILDQEQKMLTAGKEDINKLSKRISQFLIEIRKTGWDFKQVLDQHNKMKSQLDDNEKRNYWVFALKMVVMSVIILIQFIAVKYMFQ